MTARQVTIRDAVYDKIVADAPTYVITDLNVGKTFYPRQQLTDALVKPSIWITAKSPSVFLGSEIRQPEAVIFNLEVEVSLHQKVDVVTEIGIETLVELYEQIMVSCMDHDLVTPTRPRYLFQRIDPFKDPENDIVYNYEQLTENGVFHSIFTAFYQLMNQPS